jgi:hypothetical protein
MKGTRIVAVVVGIGLWAGWAPERASAAPSLTVCQGEQFQQYNPGLTITPRITSFSATTSLSTCLSTSPGILSGGFSITGSGVISCTAGSVLSQLTLTWNTGEMSVIQLVSPLDLKPDGETVVVSQGSVLSGKFKGATVTEVLTLVSTEVTACFSSAGLVQSSGPVVLTITSLL